MNARKHFLPILCLISLSSSAFGGDPHRSKSDQHSRVTTNDDYKPFTINNIFNYYSNNGDGSYNRYTSNSGFEFPKGSGMQAIFEDGIVWGGFHKDTLSPKIGGSVYRHALQAGRILVPGGPTKTDLAVADDPLKEMYRIYRVRPDVTPATTFEDVRLGLEQEAALIARYEPTVTAATLFDSYVKDWNEWPGKGSASDPLGLGPFKDINGNGIYDPAVDIPGHPGADQTLYFVANDLNEQLTQNLGGCQPIGLEVHRTFWGYDRDGALGNAIFGSTVVINKSGAPVDSMFLVQWSDPDVGDAGDDLAGCDTSRDLGFCYNGRPVDYLYGSAVPSSGYRLLQGPIVPGEPTDSALFRQEYRKGFNNLDMTTFVFFSSGWLQWADPPQGPGGALGWYYLMNGLTRDGNPFINPLTNQPTKFAVDGDPATGTGWIDGVTVPGPADRRICLVTGPFTFANGDTQEIVTATMVARGDNRIASVNLLKNYSDIVASSYRSLLRASPPGVTAAVAFPSFEDSAQVTVRVDTRDDPADSVAAILKDQLGATVGDFACYDDGTHGDVAAGDHIFSNEVPVARYEQPLDLDVLTSTPGPGGSLWPRILSRITVAGIMDLSDPVVFSDNINSDGESNPGENIRYGLSIRNGTPWAPQIRLVSSYSEANYRLITPGKVHQMSYNAADPGSYLTVDIPTAYAEPTFTIPFSIYDDQGNAWRDTITLDVVPFTDTLKSALLTHVAGAAAGAFDIMVVNKSEMKDHLYVIRGVDSINSAREPGITLKDSTDGRILLLNHPLPDTLGHNTPVTDGFKVLRGTTDHQFGFKTYEIPNGTRRWSWAGGSGLALEGFNGAIGIGSVSWSSSSSVGLRQLRSVLVRFARTDEAGNLVDIMDTTISQTYRYLRNSSLPLAKPEFAPYIVRSGPGFAYQDYIRNLPFAAYDFTNSPPRRLMVGYLENNDTSGRVDGKYWPPLTGDVDNTITSGPREWFFIFDVPYSDTPDPTLQTDITSDTLPLLWWGTPTRRSAYFEAGDEFIIRAFQTPTSNDVWTFNPNLVVSVEETIVPSTFQLLQNYPNPFNPKTEIRSQMSEVRHVRLVIYDLLGREVAVLVDERRAAGDYQDTLDGSGLASGVYIYRLTAGSFVQSRKMILLK